MHVNRQLLAIICICGVASIASTAALAEDLVSIGNETAMYQAMAKRAEARRDYEKTLAEVEQYTATTTADDPTVNWIEGVGSRLLAQLQNTNGSVLQVKEGDQIDNNGTRIISIKPGEVLIRRDTRTIRLAATSPNGNVPSITVPPGAPSPSFMPGMPAVR